MIRRAAALLGLALPLVLLTPAPAGAHEVDPTVRTVIDAVEPEVPGIHIEVGTSVTTQLLLDNTTEQPIEVLDDAGQPFLRIGPHGVEANLAAPAWYLTNQPFGGGTVPPGATADAPARWATVSEQHAFGWFDHRLHPTAVTSVLGDAALPTFEVPMRWGGEDVVVRGHLERRTTLPAFAATLRSAPDASTGLEVRLLDGRAPGLFLRYTGTGDVVVLGQDEEPFLRLGPAGAEVNEHSPVFLFTAQARGEDLTGIDADARAEPVWRSVGESPSYAWLDPRALIERVGDDPVTQDWTVPLVVDGRPLRIDGRSIAQLTPISEVNGSRGGDGGPGAGLVAVVALAVVTVAGAVWLVRGRG